MEYKNKRTWNDKWIIEHVYPGKRNGTFVEAGVCSGIGGSSTYLLEDKLGWTGFIFEPSDFYWKPLSKIRPNSKKFHACLGDGNDVEYIEFEEFGESTTKIQDYHKKKLKHVSRKSIIKPSIKLEDVIKGIHIDYLALDTNGNELEILEGLEDCSFGAISVELPWQDIDPATILMNSRGYKKVLNPFRDEDMNQEHYFLKF